MNQNKITVLRHEGIDFKKAKQAFNLSDQEAERTFKDGGFLSPLSECWCADLFICDMLRKGKKGYDLVCIAPGESKGDHYSVKSLTKNTTVHRSEYTGVGRKCTPEAVKSSLSDAQGFIFVDATRLPTLFYILIPQKILQQWHETGKLSKNGGNVSYKKFYTYLYLERSKIDNEPRGLFPEDILKAYDRPMNRVFSER